MPANITFTEFTDEEVFLEDKEAANIFFGTIQVPNATTEAYGVVKKAASIAGTEAGLEAAFNLTVYRVTVLEADGSETHIDTVDKTQVDAALNSLRIKLNALITALGNAGTIA